MSPASTEHDGPDVHERYEKIISGRAQGIGGDTYYGYRDKEEVTRSFALFGLPAREHNVELIQGLFEEIILPRPARGVRPSRRGLVESTMTCLTRTAPPLGAWWSDSARRYYTWSGCSAATDDYFADRDGSGLSVTRGCTSYGFDRPHVVKQCSAHAA